jgi:hypothetical protein
MVRQGGARFLPISAALVEGVLTLGGGERFDSRMRKEEPL